ncbi:hypothetical protein [Alteromonas gracilis]|uniref:hypothetical protein n=1 Tax=Alteromonas gracilis TaxID=1479524 RepID=UPI0037359A92
MVGSQHHYRFFNVNNVLFDIPSNVYDDRTVEGWFENIVREGRKLDEWVIFSIPDKSLTITHTAASQLCSRMPFLKSYGCLGFLLLATHTNAKIFHHSLKSTSSNFDIKISESMEELCRSAESMLGREGNLNIFNRYS